MQRSSDYRIGRYLVVKDRGHDGEEACRFEEDNAPDKADDELIFGFHIQSGKGKIICFMILK